MSKRGEGLTALYIKFLKVYLRAHNKERYEEAHKKAQDLWHGLKVGKKVVENRAQALIFEWEARPMGQGNLSGCLETEGVGWLFLNPRQKVSSQHLFYFILVSGVGLYNIS